jgi:hypothetical protein
MEVMRELIRSSLEFKKLYPYFKDRLEGVNELSIEVLNLVDFNDGFFFTLLPNNANLDRIYNLNEGLILPQNPKLLSEDRKSYFQYIPTLREEVSEYIYEKMCSTNPTLNCIIDDFNSSITRPSLEFFKSRDLFASFSDQVYYKLPSSMANAKIIDELLFRSNAFWHSLCLLTEADFSDIINVLTSEKIREICLKTQMIITGAYDGEGYVFWERNKI